MIEIIKNIFIAFLISVGLISTPNLGAVFQITSVDKLNDPAFTTLLDDITTRIVTAENDYFIQNGTYFQGIKTHDIVPKDGTREISVLTRKPTYQDYSFKDAGLSDILSDIPVVVKVHQYKTPKGEFGFVIIYTIDIGGDIYMKTVGYGVENRTRDWEKIEKQ